MAKAAPKKMTAKERHAQMSQEIESTVKEKREELARKGLVDIDLNPVDVIQRAIDDTAGDYAIMRAIMDEYETPQEAFRKRPFLAEYSASLRSEMTKYATLALNYNLAERQVRLREVEVAILGRLLKHTLEEIGVPAETIRQLPKALERNLVALQEELPHS